MIIQPFATGYFSTNAYVVACPETHIAAIIDPAEGSTPLITSYLAKHELRPEKILITHSHWDHIADVAKLKAEYRIPVFIHPEDAQNLEQPGSDGLPLWISIPGVKPDHYLHEGDIISIGNLKLKVIHTPGHTPGGVCFYCPKENILFSGDTLFKGTIGNLSFPTARPDKMWPSLTKLAKLPSETRVFPGHGESTTIGAETWLPDAKHIYGY